MAHAEKSVTINRQAQVVFDFILEGKNNPVWRPGVSDIQQVGSSSIGVGTQFKQGMKGPGGGRIDADYTIVECEPPHRIAFEVTAGPARPTGLYVLNPVGSSTQLTFSLDFQPKGLARLMDGMIQKQMVEEVGNLDKLKAHLEATPA